MQVIVGGQPIGNTFKARYEEAVVLVKGGTLQAVNSAIVAIIRTTVELYTGETSWFRVLNGLLRFNKDFGTLDFQPKSLDYQIMNSDPWLRLVVEMGREERPSFFLCLRAFQGLLDEILKRWPRSENLETLYRGQPSQDGVLDYQIIVPSPLRKLRVCPTYYPGSEPREIGLNDLWKARAFRGACTLRANSEGRSRKARCCRGMVRVLRGGVNDSGSSLFYYKDRNHSESLNVGVVRARSAISARFT
jgi:hypothetical protein